ncbi:MAG: ATP-dependent DNA helicase [Rhodocyclaceae bacterium]|nr:ATP-dependent DNA helicase [Rhodocyclaceae bacterium]MBX3670521.1 ATP-dependent DNA helicase [Rhodocyclaceae bacterium]
MALIDDVFSADGALARAVPAFRARAQQIAMARAVAAAIAEHAVLVAEAGTGTGKTFAYLAPALLSGAKVIVSTGTKTLQDQLYQRDLPTVREALGVPVSVALLKGRANYVCQYHLDRALESGRLASREDAAHLREIARFAQITRTGDKAECEVPEHSPVWGLATSTRDNCLGSECPHFKQCFVMLARRDALAADVVVVNHHLFFADVMLRDEGMGELLPACNAVVFDEAHQLPETASMFFGESLTTLQLIELARDTRLEALKSAPDFPPLQDACRDLDKAARDLRLSIPEEHARFAARDAEARPLFPPALDVAAKRLDEFVTSVGSQGERSEGLAHCTVRAQEIAARLARWRAGDTPDNVRWVELYTQSMALNSTPLEVADIFQRQMNDHPRAWIFTSATLSVGGDFSHYCGELGLAEARTACWDSPFDYPNCGLLYVPTGLPEPNSPGYNEACAAAAWPALRAAGGGAFVLCTSLRAMRRIHAWIAERLEAEALDLPLLLQGEGSRAELLARFRRAGNAILVASQSFWEGVDVRGRALRLVVIDRLPFAPPDDPVTAARIDSMQKSGRKPFFEYQLPRAVISMKQGAGRLIRDETDHGVLMVCDPRMVEKSYGKLIWRALPPLRRTRSLEQVEWFFEDHGDRPGAA